MTTFKKVCTLSLYGFRWQKKLATSRFEESKTKIIFQISRGLFEKILNFLLSLTFIIDLADPGTFNKCHFHNVSKQYF